MTSAAFHYVYRFWGRDGEPAYVGCTSKPKERMTAHKSWAVICAPRVDMCRCSSRSEALALEANEIARLKPWRNATHNPDYDGKSEGVETQTNFYEVDTSLDAWRKGGFEGLYPLTGKEVIDEMNKADPKAPKVKTPQSFYNWKAKGFEGFYPAEPIAETDDEQP